MQANKSVHKHTVRLRTLCKGVIIGLFFRPEVFHFSFAPEVVDGPGQNEAECMYVAAVVRAEEQKKLTHTEREAQTHSGKFSLSLPDLVSTKNRPTWLEVRFR